MHLVPVPLLGEAGASAWEGQAPIGAWGLAPTIWTRIAQASEGTTHLEMRFGVAAGNKLVVVGLLLLVFCCPVAIVCGYLAYRDFERRKESALRAVWGHLGHLTGVPAEPMAASTAGR